MRAMPKSRIFSDAVVLDHQVRRLDVAMDDAGLVREAEAVAELVDDLQLARDASGARRRG